MNIKPNELRIGSFVDLVNRSNVIHLPSGHTFRVMAIGQFEVQLLPNEVATHEATPEQILTVPTKDICGISLTDELLVRFGWVWNEECDSYEKPSQISMNMQLRFGGWTMFNYVTKALIAKRIFYVHQLQNLCFAMTGNELDLQFVTQEGYEGRIHKED